MDANVKFSYQDAELPIRFQMAWFSAKPITNTDIFLCFYVNGLAFLCGDDPSHFSPQMQSVSPLNVPLASLFNDPDGGCNR